MNLQPSLPTHNDLFEPTIKALKALGGSGSIQEIYDKVCELEGYSEEQQSVLHKEGSKTAINYRLGWARSYLKTYGLLENVGRGIWSLTEQGRNLQSVDKKQINRAVRRKILKAPSETSEDSATLQDEESTTLQDIVVADEILKTLPLDTQIPVDSEVWIEKLLSILQNIPPDAFERLCQRLLRESGFIKVEVTGKKGDGGIDGIGVLKIALLSFQVFFQCKRYLRQTMKLREDVKQLKLEVKNGFIDLKKVLKDQGSEIILRIDQVAQDVKFEQHRLVLIQAYGKFLEATKLMKIAISCEDVSIRNADLANARQMLAEALADYNNPRLLSETSAAGQLRRLECGWAIDQTIALSYQLQNESAAVSDRLSYLQDKIRQDSLTVIDRCETEDELDFLFPELTRIHDHDLAVLESWQNHVDWMRSLPASELKLLQSADFNNSEIPVNSNINTDTIADSAPLEQLLYENLKQKSHPDSLLDQLQFMMKPELRRDSESYITQQAAIAGYKTLVPANLQKASDLAVANLYWYFKVRDESEEEVVVA